MHDQPKYKPYRPSAFFADSRNARPLVPGTVARGHLDDSSPLQTGKEGNDFVAELPVPLTQELVQRGHERFDVYCSPCHGRTGKGDGMIVRRGYRQPPSYHIDRLRAEPLGYFFDVITHGFGVMPDYAAQVPVNDRWAIAAYIRALQLSAHATLADVPASERKALSERHD